MASLCRKNVDAAALLKEVGLEDRPDPVRHFSAGMRKRLQLAMVRAQQPDLILLDEPFSALDPAAMEQVGALLQNLSGTLILASHQVERAAGLLRPSHPARSRSGPLAGRCFSRLGSVAATATSGSTHMTGALRVLRKDLLVEWRAKTHIVALAAFALVLLLLFSFAVGPDIETLRHHAAAYIWISMLLSSTLLVARSFSIETESEALEGVLLAPVSPAAIFFGKALSSTLQMMILMAVALPGAVVLFDLSVAGSMVELMAGFVLGVAGLAAPVPFMPR